MEGVIAWTIDDAALMSDVVLGPDRRSPVSLGRDEKKFLQAVENPGTKGFRVDWSDNLKITPN